MPISLMTEIRDEVTNLLADLIRIDTTNPPGNETAAAEVLQKSLEKDGFKCEIFESSPSRGSLVTRLNGVQEKPRLLLLSHLDVVAANPSEWSLDPFGGVIKDGFVWGRGALDMKGMTAIEIVALKLLKRNNIKLKGDIILAATADEEAGGTRGAEFMLNNYPDKIFAEYVLNEGGGSSIPTTRKNMYTINTSEKGLLWFRIKARGTPGHGSMPETADNAIMRMNRIIQKLGEYEPKIQVVPSVRKFLTEIAAADPTLEGLIMKLLNHPEKSNEILKEMEKKAPNIADEIRPRLRMTITPTIIKGGVKENIIPSECTAVFDCRILPGQTISHTQSLIRNLLEKSDLNKLEFEDIQAQEPSESPFDTSLYEAIKTTLMEFEPDCKVAPILMTGGTDSRFFRKVGSICYGFHPLRSENKFGQKTTRREHGIDERISIDNLVFGVTLLYETIKRSMS
jgi:acetylornithine deacetylase/succinyl-diaminopimelate desuccinylase-like protein